MKVSEKVPDDTGYVHGSGPPKLVAVESWQVVTTTGFVVTEREVEGEDVFPTASYAETVNEYEVAEASDVAVYEVLVAVASLKSEMLRTDSGR